MKGLAAAASAQIVGLDTTIQCRGVHGVPVSSNDEYGDTIESCVSFTWSVQYIVPKPRAVLLSAEVFDILF